MPRSVVNAYERGTRQPGADALARIARAAGFELRLAPRLRRVDDVRAGRILAQVLDLAERLQRSRGELAYPRLHAGQRSRGELAYPSLRARAG
jgi:hypothetical protein